MDRILRYEDRMHRQIDWAVQRLLESQERRKTVESFPEAALPATGQKMRNEANESYIINIDDTWDGPQDCSGKLSACLRGASAPKIAGSNTVRDRVVVQFEIHRS